MKHNNNKVFTIWKLEREEIGFFCDGRSNIETKEFNKLKDAKKYINEHKDYYTSNHYKGIFCSLNKITYTICSYGREYLDIKPILLV